MTTQAPVVPSDHITDGFWIHTGRLRVSYRLSTGTVVTITLPDDWQTLVARVAALEATAANVPNSIEDLKYAG
jgi:hypothetical protein